MVGDGLHRLEIAIARRREAGLDDVNAQALELARKFSNEESVQFVNGVLDAVLKEHQSLTGQTGT